MGVTGEVSLATVEAYTASWIEMKSLSDFSAAHAVEAYTASWIEIKRALLHSTYHWSRLIQPRGLKSSGISPGAGP